MTQVGAFDKLPRNSHNRIPAENMKPPEPKMVNGAPIYQLRYVSPQHKELKIPCTEPVFRRALGQRSRRRAHTGLDMQIYHRFVLVQDVATKLVVGVDMYPYRLVMHGLKRTDEPQHNCLVMSINPTTGDMTVEDYPGEVSEGHILNLLSAIDPLGRLDIGQTYNGFTVESIAAGRIFFNIHNLPDFGEEGDEDAIWSQPVNARGAARVGFSDLKSGSVDQMGGIGAR